MSAVVLATHERPSFCYATYKKTSKHDLRQTWPAVGPAFITIMLGTSPDGAQRNPGATSKLQRQSPDYAALHPGYKEIRKRNAERR
jgi:hypothetical protein